MKLLYQFFLILTLRILIFNAQKKEILENIPSLLQILDLFEFEVDDEKK